MFTGIVTDVGEIAPCARQPGGDRRFGCAPGTTCSTSRSAPRIACAGCCLTVVDKGDGWFAVEVSGETLAKTHLSGRRRARAINLERSAKVGDELGGHLVSGHVDGVGKVVAMTPEGGSMRFAFEVPRRAGIASSPPRARSPSTASR